MVREGAQTLPPLHVMVREGEPPTTLQRRTGAKEAVGGLPAQTMTAFLKGWKM
jgi:hypothetical protein